MTDAGKPLPVLGHKALTAIDPLNSSAIPSTHMDMPYFAIVYATQTQQKTRSVSLLLNTPSSTEGKNALALTRVVFEPDGIEV